MDFVVGLPRTQRGSDAFWVVVDWLTKSVHFIPIRVSDLVDHLADLYIRDIVRLHGSQCRLSQIEIHVLLLGCGRVCRVPWALD